MATKRAQEEKIKADKTRRYELSVKELKNFPLIAIAFAIVSLMLFLLNFANIYNTNMNGGKGGNEIYYTGIQLFLATISGNLASDSDMFGVVWLYDYHTHTETQISGILTIVSVLCILVIIGLSVWSVIRKKPMFNIVSAILFSIIFILLTVCFIIIKTSPIMIRYQCNLTVCSLHSYAIIPAITALIGAVVSGIATVKYFRARKILKP